MTLAVSGTAATEKQCGLNQMQLPFGKYKDYEIEDVPSDYLEWLLEHDVIRSASLREEVEGELAEREGRWSKKANYGSGGRGSWGTPPHPPPPGQHATGFFFSLTPSRLPLFKELVECGFRQLALKLHPDRGGTNENFRQLAELREELKAQLK